MAGGNAEGMAISEPESSTTDHRYGFRWSRPGAVRLARVFGITQENSWVTVGPDALEAHFGRWHVQTPLANIESVSITGPYKAWKVLGPAHLSFGDHGLTFASDTERGVCLSFREPVTGIDPFGWIKHPGLTLTVSDPEAFAADLRGR